MELYFNKVSVYQHIPDKDEYHTIVLDGKEIRTGLKWQCVELARRYLLVTKRVTFPSIPNAYNLFDLTHLIDFTTNRNRAIVKHPNGGNVSPTTGSLLIWGKDYDSNETGHVAVITVVYPFSIQIMEQNNITSHRIIPISETNPNEILEPFILGWISIK